MEYIGQKLCIIASNEGEKKQQIWKLQIQQLFLAKIYKQFDIKYWFSKFVHKENKLN